MDRRNSFICINIRAALGWSSVPVVASFLIWGPQLALFGHDIFTTETPLFDANPAMLIGFLGLSLIQAIFSIWSLITMTKCIAQVQQFTAWKALANLLLAIFFVVVIPIAILLIWAIS